MDLSLDKQVLQDILQRSLKVCQLKMLAQRLIDQYRVSKQRTCQFILLHRSAIYYIKRKGGDEASRNRITEIPKTRIRYGLQRIHTLLWREGYTFTSSEFEEIKLLRNRYSNRKLKSNIANTIKDGIEDVKEVIEEALK